MYAKIVDNSVVEYPYSVTQLKNDNPNTSYPSGMTDEMLQSHGLYLVSEAARPSYDVKTQKLVRDTTPTLVDGVWTIGWTVTSQTDEEIAYYNEFVEIENRGNRDGLLKDTDWWASSDLTMTAEQIAYRQALRDITTHANWPHLEDADWPTKP